MARSDYLSKNLGWRLLLLFFWTVLVCCVLYTSKSRQMSLVSKGYSPRFPSLRQKRVAGNMPRMQGECRTTPASQEELDALERVLNRQEQNPQDTSRVHCLVASMCDKLKPFQAHCFSKDCRAYKIRIKSRNHESDSLSTEALSRFIEFSLQSHSFTTIDDLGRYMDIQCEAPSKFSMTITGDLLSPPDCQTGPAESKRRKIPGKSTHKINVLYFRFLSQWELPIRFPGLFSLINKSATRENVNVLHFDKYQAMRWADDKTLSFFLQGRDGQFSYNDSLLDTLHTNGYCFHMEDFSCSRSRQQEALVRNVSSYQQQGCNTSFSAQREVFMDNVCSEGNLTHSETRALMTSTLFNVHDMEGKNDDLHSLLSISVLNTKDFTNSEILDYVLMNLFANLLVDKNRTVLLMSDIGDPTFLRFDLSVRLQTQASNPALLLLSTNGLQGHSQRYTEHLMRSSFSVVELHHFLRLLIQNEKDLNSSDTYMLEGFDSEDMSSCGGLNVKPPFTCLCEDQFVTYENDTLMVGFAEFAVTLINAHLQRIPLEYSNSERSHCAKLSGVSFTNVHVGFHKNKRKILMDIDLENELFRDKAVRRVVLDVWDSEKIPQAEVQVFKADPQHPYPTLTSQNDQSLKTLCQTGESLDYPTSSETGLLRRWSQQRHFGRKGRATHVHDNCLYLLVRDFGDSISVEAANVCADRQYDVVLHLSLMNMMSLSPLPLSASLGHAERHVLAVVVKVAYTVPTFAYKLHPDFQVSYDD